MHEADNVFGSRVFSDSMMRRYLPDTVYQAFLRTAIGGHKLDAELADDLAKGMKTWAIENGATHFTHWFQPLNGVTAEKHEAFLQPDRNGCAIEEFSGRELFKGESDASSFPSGGLRATFEARGYTAWDPTSYAFIKDDVLCIPTAFCSYGGEALDKKTPLLRSMEAINRQALRVLRIFGNTDVSRVFPTAGAEQEYFLIDSTIRQKRPDLIYTGRTLFGAPPPKGQELEDHYFGVVKPRVAAFMKDLDREMWRLGVYAKTEHNEVAPGQHELAPVFSVVNIAADQNQLTMEMMKKIAQKHGMSCLLHEKPFAGVNGSGKHNNWSLSTDTGINLLEPGDTPAQNAQFLLFLCAVLHAVDEYQDLLRISVASAGNDLRLGGDEAPPAILSVFLGDELTEILESIETDSPYGTREKELLRVGVHTLPRFPKDATDRNRTSPLAFTGNKFEFRMPGAPMSISECNIVIDTAVADVLRSYADQLESAVDMETALHELIQTEFRSHKRIVFNGNGYDEKWISEAKARGLSNYPTTADCLDQYLSPKNVSLFERQKVLSLAEMKARCAIQAETYCKIIHIEARTMLSMAYRLLLPAVSEWCSQLEHRINNECKATAGFYEQDVLDLMRKNQQEMWSSCRRLEEALSILNGHTELNDIKRYRDSVLPFMRCLRAASDQAEDMMPASLWPLPTYGEILFSVC